VKFLSAEWKNLILANYEIDSSVLDQHVPAGLELDTHDGKHFVSLVGFQFVNTRVLGIKWPGLHTFVELNLRFYVKRTMPDGEVRRGVVFIREIVPSRVISFVARTVYNEPYIRLPIQETSGFGADYHYGYSWRKNGGEHSLVVTVEPTSQALRENSHEEFIAEHYWGYTARRDGRTNEYEVQHPSWTYSPVSDHTINCDFDDLYGNEWAFLNNQQPYSIFLAQGSEISVAAKSRF
jgi:uncharacterized protein